MKILWITNCEMPKAAEYFGRNSLSGIWLRQSLLLSNIPEIELHVISRSYQEYEEFKIDNIYYSSFLEENTDKSIVKLISMINPDVIHIWGTEYYPSYAAIKYLESNHLLSRTVVSIQGLISYIARYHYYSFLPESVINKYTLSGIKNNCNIRKDRDDMLRRSEYEKKIFEISKNCIGRTEWDYAGVKLINKNINYYYCNEIMRNSFYNSEWNADNCNRFSIFFSQANYPLKGFHIFLEAADIIKKTYPQVKIKVLGKPIENNFISYIHDSSYQRYIRKLINKYSLWENIVWLGSLEEEEMVSEFLQANVFVCSSTIENSSNSVGEAMLLGVPVVASNVGGMNSLLENKKEGLLYQADAPYLLAYDVMRIFEDSNLATELGKNARKRALVDHDQKVNTNILVDIYNELYKVEKE